MNLREHDLQERARLASEVERLKDENERLWARAQEFDSHAGGSTGVSGGGRRSDVEEDRPRSKSAEEQERESEEVKERYDSLRIVLLSRARRRRQKMTILHRFAKSRAKRQERKRGKMAGREGGAGKGREGDMPSLPQESLRYGTLFEIAFLHPRVYASRLSRLVNAPCACGGVLEPIKGGCVRI